MLAKLSYVILEATGNYKQKIINKQKKLLLEAGKLTAARRLSAAFKEGLWTKT
jgi:hypothetical protein